MAEKFIPERWLDDPRFAGDAKRALQPFSVGPRNCIGKKYVIRSEPGFLLQHVVRPADSYSSSLANAEMRLILARLIWNFDIRAAENLHHWYDDSEVYILWQKGPVNVYLMPRV